jgi:hypothetical protein
MRSSPDLAVSAGDEQLTVSVAGTPAGQGLFQYDSGGPDWHAPWEQLPKVVVPAKPQDSLRDVLVRGAEALGVSLTPMASKAHDANRKGAAPSSVAEAVVDMIAYAAFRREDDDEKGDGTEGVLRREARSRKHLVLAVRDSAGHALWRRPPFTATMAELIDAYEVGLLQGDPLRPYLVLVIPQGGIGLIAEWQQLQQSLEAAWHLSGVAAQIAGAFSFFGFVNRFIQRNSGEAARAIERNSPDWTQRGAAPADLEELLATKPWRSAEVAALLGCSESEAEAILWGLGFTPQGDGGPWVHRSGS